MKVHALRDRNPAPSASRLATGMIHAQSPARQQEPARTQLTCIESIKTYMRVQDNLPVQQAVDSVHSNAFATTLFTSFGAVCQLVCSTSIM